jgi:hypothetical protein
MCNIFVGVIYILYLFSDIKFANACNCCIVTFTAKNLKKGAHRMRVAGADLLLRMQEIFFKKMFIHFYFKIFPSP